MTAIESLVYLVGSPDAPELPPQPKAALVAFVGALQDVEPYELGIVRLVWSAMTSIAIEEGLSLAHVPSGNTWWTHSLVSFIIMDLENYKSIRQIERDIVAQAKTLSSSDVSNVACNVINVKTDLPRSIAKCHFDWCASVSADASRHASLNDLFRVAWNWHRAKSSECSPATAIAFLTRRAQFAQLDAPIEDEELAMALASASLPFAKSQVGSGREVIAAYATVQWCASFVAKTLSATDLWSLWELVFGRRPSMLSRVMVERAFGKYKKHVGG
jgi:hypothetical protein